MDTYHQKLNGKQAAWAKKKKYNSHQMKGLDEAGVY
jgi:hypothetical protein